MLDLGFSEILLIGIIAIVVLGPEKLPETMAKIFKFLRKAKNMLLEAKSSIDKELQIEELREEANRYKEELMSASQKLEELANREIKNPINNEVKEVKKIEYETKEKVTLKKDSAKSQLKSLLESENKDV